MSTSVESWYDAETPDVSVVVVNFNRADLTARCLQALSANTGGYRYEIIVVDNGSARDEVEKLCRISSLFRLIALPENRHFGEGSNVGARSAKGRFIVFLNNDAFATPGWLPPLMSLFEKLPDVGAVGPRFVWPDGRLQEAGAFIDKIGRPIQIGIIRPYDPREEFEIRIVDYCSAACLIISRKLFLDMGGFDPVYYPSYYEDVDLCFKIRSLGQFVYYCPGSTIVHLTNATSIGVWTRSEVGTIFERNRITFLGRWGEYLRSRDVDLLSTT